MKGAVVMTGTTIQNAFLAGVHNSQAQPAAQQASARTIAAISAVNPSARNREHEAPQRRLESAAELSKSWDRGVQARDPRGRNSFESELQARVDPALRRSERRRRGRRLWGRDAQDPREAPE